MHAHNFNSAHGCCGLAREEIKASMRGEGLISSDSGDIFSSDPRVRQSLPYDTPAPKAWAPPSSLREEVGIGMSGAGCRLWVVRHRPSRPLNNIWLCTWCHCQHCQQIACTSREPVTFSPQLAIISLFSLGLSVFSPWPQAAQGKEWDFSCSSPGPCQAGEFYSSST